MNTESTVPPSRINGRKNPEYTRWYRTTQKGKESVKKWNASQKAKEASAKHAKKPKVKKAKREKSLATYHKEFPFGSLKCLKCKKDFCKTAVTTQGWPRIGRYTTVCEACEN